MIETKANKPAQGWVCHAVWCLNIQGKPAKATEFIVGTAPCRSTQYVWSPIDSAYMCLKCWTLCRDATPLLFEYKKETMSTKQEIAILALQRFVNNNKWDFDSEKPAPGGILFFIKDRDYRVAVTCYQNGRIQIQGKDSPQKLLLRSWAKNYLNNNGSDTISSLWDEGQADDESE